MEKKDEHKSNEDLIAQIDDLRYRLREIEDSLTIKNCPETGDATTGHIKRELLRSQYSIEHATDAIFWVNSEGGFEYVNISACESLGYSREELLKMSIFDVNLNFTKEAWAEHWQKVRDEGSVLIESRHRAKGGKVFHVEIAINYVKYDEVEYNCAFARDISKRKRTELALYLSEQRFRAIADYTYDWELWLSPGGRVLWTNPAVERVSGYTVGECMAMYDYPMSIISVKDRPAVKAAFKSADEGESGSGLEVRLQRKDGEIIWVSISWMPIYDLKGVSQGYRASIRDVNLRKQIQAEREELLKTLEAQNEELESIVYVSSHDLRTPLVNILGFGGELSLDCSEIKEVLDGVEMDPADRLHLDEILDIEFPQSLGFITSSAKQIDSLLDGLLKISRITRSPLVIEPIDMGQMTGGILQNLHDQIQKKDVEITVDKLPKCNADSVQVNQIFTNLIDNALKFLDPGRKGKIHVSGWTSDDMSVYCVEDNGIGIASEYADIVFEVFQQVSHTKLFAGEGLGLTIVKRLVGRNNGKVWLESELGKGSKFFVALPKFEESPEG